MFFRQEKDKHPQDKPYLEQVWPHCHISGQTLALHPNIDVQKQATQALFLQNESDWHSYKSQDSLLWLVAPVYIYNPEVTH